MGDNDRTVDSRATKNKGIGKKVTPSWLQGGQTLGPEVREKRDGEIKRSKTSKGMVISKRKNKYGGTWVWLLYDFAVNDYDLKKGHISGLQKIVGEILKYSNLFRVPCIFVRGHASPSGTDKRNKELALLRTHQVINWLVSQGGISANKFSNPTNADLYSLIKKRPTEPKLRALLRSVEIILYYKQDFPEPILFPEHLRKRTYNNVIIPNRFSKHERLFYIWILENWKYFVDEKNKYCWEAYPLSKGMFFKKPKKKLKNDKEIKNYLKKLYKNFTESLNRLNHQYTGVKGLYNPVCPIKPYQQLLRWMILFKQTNNNISAMKYIIPIISIVNTMNQLITMINNKKYGTPSKVWNKIENNIKSNKIPEVVIKKPL